MPVQELHKIPNLQNGEIGLYQWIIGILITVVVYLFIENRWGNKNYFRKVLDLNVKFVEMQGETNKVMEQVCTTIETLNDTQVEIRDIIKELKLGSDIVKNIKEAAAGRHK